MVDLSRLEENNLNWKVSSVSSFLIKYQRRSGHLVLEKFESLLEATKKRLELDKENKDPDLEIVAVASQSEESLRQSHSRYFSAA
ncbi:hypothetical protein [Pasteurella phage PMP-GADVASU-IND]|nr:hypothetical protein [Pasteurella phage PMP-GADVASU-IND]